MAGAADSFLGAMVWSLGAGQSIQKAFRYASPADQRRCAGTGLCKAEDARRFYHRLKRL